ncbi:MAG: NAD(P)/FAD-dependent oxidoreductase [Thermodesulfobacteriota bacterium]|nr:NAD(P)/FAD-dependent oxidoreductase [Thermodesulfobacteriota bacterium]
MEEIYDIVIIGGGTNSLSIASYLGKCGLSVCICEARPECGGGVENTEPIPDVRIDPHATYLYGGAAPAFEQLELHKFGFRMVYYKNQVGGVLSDGTGFSFGQHDMDATLKCVRKFSEKDASLAEMLSSLIWENRPATVKLLRSIYWTPPPPPHVQLQKEDFPWSKVLNEMLPGIYDPSWNDMSTMELMDLLWDSEPVKVLQEMGAWFNGPYPEWKGTAIQGLTCNLLMTYSNGCPRGGMHSLAHALVRCAMHHGARIYTNSRVEEIIVEDGEAKGVILDNFTTAKTKKILARKAVLSNIHVQPTFLDLIPSSALENDFLKRIGALRLHGGNFFVLSLVTSEMPEFIGDANETFANGRWPSSILMNIDSREAMLNMGRICYEENTHPVNQEDMILSVSTHSLYDKTHRPVDGRYVISPIYLQLPPPEYHKDGPTAVNDAKDEIVDAMLTKIRSVAPNLTDDKIVAKFVNTPYDSSLRNMAFVGGGWMGLSQSSDQWYDKRPLPELARYRTPVKNLYLCHQCSYPGGLALQAVSYNLMHILIEDLNLEPGDWWYPSEFFIPSDA